MAKKKPALSKPPQRMTKRERSRHEREQRIQRTFVIILVAIGVISVLVLAFGLIWDQLWYPNQALAEVNGEPILRKDYWASSRMELVSQWQQAISSYQLYQSIGITMTDEQVQQFQAGLRQTLYQLGRVTSDPVDETVMQRLIEERAVLQGARAMGLTVTDEEADYFLLPGPQPVTATSPFSSEPLTATQSPTQTAPTPTPANTLSPQERSQQIVDGLTNVYNALKRDMRASGAGNLGFSARDYVAMVRYSARVSVLQQKVQDELAKGLPKEEEQVQAWHILIKDRAGRAREALQQLQQAVSRGGSLAGVVLKYSDDAASRDRAGELVIQPGAGQVSPEVEAAALALTQADPLSPVIEDAAGVHLLQFVGRDAAGAVTVRHILIPADRKSKAEGLRATVLANPTTFSQVAVSSSEDKSTASGGGDMGWIARGDGKLSALLETAAFAMTQTNAISPVLEDEAGYHILQLVGRDDAGDRVRLRQILILRGQDLAQQVLDEVRSGTLDFVQAVVDQSAETATVELAGDIGWIDRGDGRLPDRVIDAAFALTQTAGLDSLSPVIDDDTGYYIVQLLERDEAAGRVHLRMVLLKRAQQLAEEIRTYIVGGDPQTLSGRFMEMALKYSDDAESKSKGGDLGWFGRGKTTTTIEIEEQAFAMEPGTVRVFEGASGFHVVWVREHDMNHPIDEETLNQRAEQAFQDWKTTQVQKAVVVRHPAPTPTPTPTPPPFVPTETPVTAPATP